MGAGVIDRLRETSQSSSSDIVEFRGGLPLIKEDTRYKKYANKKTKAYYLIKEMLQLGRLKILSPQIIKELEQIRFSYSSSGVKQVMRKEVVLAKYKIKSPDSADALMMAISEAPNIYKAYEESESRLPKYTTSEEEVMAPRRAGLPEYASAE